MNLTPTEAAWCAGVFSAMGHFTIHRQTHELQSGVRCEYVFHEAHLHSVKVGTVEKFAKLVGRPIRYHTYKRDIDWHRSRRAKVLLRGDKALEFCDAILPFLPPKRRKECIAFMGTIKAVHREYLKKGI